METTDYHALYHALEHAALAAWPAREVEQHQGWWLRASDGVTKRANSATVLNPEVKDLSQHIALCEDFYAARQLACILRLPSFVDPGTLDRQLADQGYSFFDLSLVLHRPLQAPTQTPDPALQGLPRDAWLETFAALSQLDANSLAGQRGILGRIQGQCYYAVLCQDQAPVCAGLGVVSGRYFGVFDVITHPAQRRQGCARHLIQGLLAWAWQAGAREGYLQVVAANHPAIAVYEGLGYRRAYDYWYRLEP